MAKNVPPVIRITSNYGTVYEMSVDQLLRIESIRNGTWVPAADTMLRLEIKTGTRREIFDFQMPKPDERDA